MHWVRSRLADHAGTGQCVVREEGLVGERVIAILRSKPWKACLLHVHKRVESTAPMGSHSFDYLADDARGSRRG